MIFSQAGDLPHHIYCQVDMAHTRLAKTGFEDCVWFGLNSTHGRLWGCNVLLEWGGGRFAVLPTDHIIVHETSFTNAKWPDDIKRQTETYSCENADDCFGGRAET
jgi:hypothetical protein